MPDKTKKKGKTPATLSVDFSNVEERRQGGGKAAHVPEGDYLLRVDAAEIRRKKDDKTSKYISWQLGIAEPSKFGKKGSVYHITTLKEEGLWSLRNFLDDLGIKVPKSKLDIPLAEIVKKHMLIGATLTDGEPYNDKIKSEISATFPKGDYEGHSDEAEEEDDEEEEEAEEEADDDEDDDDDEEEEKPKKKAKKSKKSKKSKSDDDEDEDEDLEELDTDDL